MKTRTTDQLIADVLAVALGIKHHLDQAKAPTAVQRDTLCNAVESLHTYLKAWERHHSPQAPNRGHMRGKGRSSTHSKSV